MVMTEIKRKAKRPVFVVFPILSHFTAGNVGDLFL